MNSYTEYVIQNNDRLSNHKPSEYEGIVNQLLLLIESAKCHEIFEEQLLLRDKYIQVRDEQFEILMSLLTEEQKEIYNKKAPDDSQLPTYEEVKRRHYDYVEIS